MSRLNLTKLSEHCCQTLVVGARGQTLDEDVEEAALPTLALLTALMGEDLDLLAVELELLGLGDGRGGRLLSLELDVAKAAALPVGVELEFARANRAKLAEGRVELLLSDAQVDVANEQVCLGLHEVALLHVAADKVAANLGVVQFRGAPLGLLRGEELEEAVAVLALGLLVNVDDRLVHVVPEVLHVLV